MRTIILYGDMAKRFGKYHRFSVKSASEAIRALKANFKGFESYMGGAHLEGFGFRIFVGGAGLRGYDEAKNPAGANDIIRIVPTVFGSGSGWVKILIGAVLVIGGIVADVVTGGTAGNPFIIMGVGLIIGGVSQLLATPPGVPGSSSADLKKSYLFSGPENVTAQGSPVPVGYGRMMVGSVIISAGIETFDE